ncbi:hypothetical protein GO988_17405 [Hymenobacter sp. HMF4947]|uniref:Uncharacterized protein n=1 Tax=Hymenobacter ginkgonis TaxID=2682976 RepID=A0A7K1TI74_9BACT|nr:hypothetical protein [Hymenobacter ginkgonis]MVN78109.1 hypothetical protein [Hymenobacter ginkgonis]
MTPTTAYRLAGRATGAIFFTLFGAAWLSLWLVGIQHLTLLTEAGVVLGALALLFVSAWVLQRAKQVPTAPVSPEEAALKKRHGRVFGWVNAAQWGTIFLLGWLLPRLGYGQDMVPAIVIVVGLHLFPLAHLFANPIHHLTGGALVAWALGCLLLGQQPDLQAQAALGAGCILWVRALAGRAGGTRVAFA